MVNKHVFKAPFNFNTPLIKKLGQEDKALRRGKGGCHINQLCVSSSSVFGWLGFGVLVFIVVVLE